MPGLPGMTIGAMGGKMELPGIKEPQKISGAVNAGTDKEG